MLFKMAEKVRLRPYCERLRESVAPEEKRAQDEALARAILAHEAFASADLLLCFSPVRGEPDLTPVYHAAMERSIKVAFPRTKGNDMTFRLVKDLLVFGAMRIVIGTVLPHGAEKQLVGAFRFKGLFQTEQLQA